MSNTDGTKTNTDMTDEQEFGGVASFADAETREILNLLNQSTDADQGENGGCCGGGCCS